MAQDHHNRKRREECFKELIANRTKVAKLQSDVKRLEDANKMVDRHNSENFEELAKQIGFLLVSALPLPDSPVVDRIATTNNATLR